MLALLNNEMNKRGYIFEGMRRWPDMNFVILIQDCSYLISLEIAVGYSKVRSFQGAQFNLSVLIEKLYITYQSPNF